MAATAVTDAVFLDSGIFVALLAARDQRHAQAIVLFGGRTPRWCTSYLVVSETYAWFLHREGEEAARSFRSLVESLAASGSSTSTGPSWPSREDAE